MTDVYSGNSQFTLLTNTSYRRRWFDRRSLFLLIIVTVPVVVFCVAYILILKCNSIVLYPKSHSKVPYLLPHRANAYSRHERDTYEDNWDTTLSRDFKHVNDYKLVCYYSFPVTDSKDLQPENIDPFLCTHINVGFVRIKNNTAFLPDRDLQTVTKLVDLKKVNDNLKILISVGGMGNDGSFNEMVLNHANRKCFIHSIVDLVKTYKIDGVDLDWEFPNENPNVDKHQKLHFTQLLEEFRMTIDKQKRHKFLLTIAVGAPRVIIDNSYDGLYINKFVDFINLMAYDFHFYTKITPFTGLNSPLYKSLEDKSYFTTLNINYSAHYWVASGVDREKIIIGVPTYAHTFRLTNPHNKGLYAPAQGYGHLGDSGFADYTQVCEFLSINKISPVFDSYAKSPYAMKGVEWVSFDNEQSLSLKAEFVRDYEFGGVMVYCLNSDDYMGTCKLDPKVTSKQFPLVEKIREILSSNYSIF